MGLYSTVFCFFFFLLACGILDHQGSPGPLRYFISTLEARCYMRALLLNYGSRYMGVHLNRTMHSIYSYICLIHFTVFLNSLNTYETDKCVARTGVWEGWSSVVVLFDILNHMHVLL